jgi:hypothetical protein
MLDPDPNYINPDPQPWFFQLPASLSNFPPICKIFPPIFITPPGVISEGVEQPWQAYHVTVEPLECQQPPQEGASSSSRRHYGLARFVTPWALDTTQVNKKKHKKEDASSSRRHYGLARFVTPWALDT